MPAPITITFPSFFIGSTLLNVFKDVAVGSLVAKAASTKRFPMSDEKNRSSASALLIDMIGSQMGTLTICLKGNNDDSRQGAFSKLRFLQLVKLGSMLSAKVLILLIASISFNNSVAFFIMRNDADNTNGTIPSESISILESLLHSYQSLLLQFQTSWEKLRSSVFDVKESAEQMQTRQAMWRQLRETRLN
ncbi:hypothetical protein GQX74_004091 [Glossina fuscipes]|nr:hypothetical protein GQX74_004091 [Glossina fuscipes]